MTKTFTISDLTAVKSKEEELPSLPDFAEPSESLLRNILNYSRNLEIKTSIYTREVSFIKS